MSFHREFRKGNASFDSCGRY